MTYGEANMRVSRFREERKRAEYDTPKNLAESIAIARGPKSRAGITLGGREELG